ncbi:MAG: hypothetical protein M1838_001771 [Thelocarpon superellum]|nr:MAG: hypothetical protein M1838_001771 [Thelocarpon superellum]
MVISSGDSIFVASSLLCDPADVRDPSELRRVVGNVGHAGIAMLIPPINPRVRAPDVKQWRVITHAPFDGILEDHFPNTSLHLAFTEYESSIDAGEHGARGKELFFLESLVQVHDQGKWVADLDILSGLESQHLIRPMCKCPQLDDASQPSFSRDAQSTPEAEHMYPPSLTAIDNWEEFLD